MVKKLFILFIFVVIVSCEKTPDLSNIEGVQMYLYDDGCENKNSYLNLGEEKFKRQFSELNSLSQIPLELCHWYIDESICVLENSPFLNKTDIEKYDWNKSTLYLTEAGEQKIEDLEISMTGRAFNLRVNDNEIVKGWLWNQYSSSGCDRVYTMRNQSNVLTLEFGLILSCSNNPLLDKSNIIAILQ